MYADYLLKRLEGFEKFNPNVNISKEEIIDAAQKLAYHIFEGKKYGLEIPIEDAKLIFGGEIETVLLIFNYTKVGRIGQGFTKKFSFVHRRFYEYFVAKELLKRQYTSILDSIPNDSKWRDALVLYCEVAPFHEAQAIANFCWEKNVQHLYHGDRNSMAQDQWLHAIHTFRFLIDAFKTRKECLGDLIVAFTNMIRERFHFQYFKGTKVDTLELDILAQGLGLLDETNISRILPAALHKESRLISESAINACRHLGNLSKEMLVEIINFYDSTKNVEFARKASYYLYPLKLSNIFNKVYQFGKFKLAMFYLRSILLMILFVINPITLGLYLGVQLLIPFVWINYAYTINHNSKVGEKFLSLFFSQLFFSTRSLRQLLFIVGSYILLNKQISFNPFYLNHFLEVQVLIFLLLIPIPNGVFFYSIINSLKVTLSPKSLKRKR